MTLHEWLAFNKAPKYEDAPVLGRFAGFVVVLLSLVLSACAVAALFHLFLALFALPPYAESLDTNALRNIGLVVVGLVGAPFLIWRAFLTAKQVRVAEESLVNEKVSSAANGLAARREISVLHPNSTVVTSGWEDDLVVRSTAIDALEAIAFEQPFLAPRICRLLSTYVRATFPQESLEPNESPEDFQIPRIDLQAAVSALGRMHKTARDVDKSNWRLDFRSCDFSGVSFRDGYFFACDFTNSRMEACNFTDANLSGAYFRGCLLNYSFFLSADATGAKFDRAIINLPKPGVGRFSRSLNLAILRGATFVAADLSAINHLGGAEVISQTFGTKDTKLGSRYITTRPSAVDHETADLYAGVSEDDLDSEIVEIIRKVEKSGFLSWSPFDSIDLANGQILGDLYEKLDLKRWPYWQ